MHEADHKMLIRTVTDSCGEIGLGKGARAAGEAGGRFAGPDFGVVVGAPDSYTDSAAGEYPARKALE